MIPYLTFVPLPAIALPLALVVYIFLFLADWRLRVALTREAVGRQWEMVRRLIDQLIRDHAGITAELRTYYEVPSEAEGLELRRWLLERWPDVVEVGRGKVPGTEQEWVVDATSAPIRLTPLIGRQWLARIRTVCESRGCRIARIGVSYGGDPPVPEPVAVLLG